MPTLVAPRAGGRPLTGWSRLRSAVRGRRLLALVTALAAGAVLLIAPPASRPRPPAVLTAAQAWPGAHRGTMPADLPDGTAYEPAVFLDARTSVGAAPSPDGRSLRLVLRRADGTLRQLRRLPVARDPSFPSLAVAGNVLVWVESMAGHQELWRVDLDSGRPPRRLTADTGDARFYHSQYDLVIAQGRVHWVAAGRPDVTELRSVALAGGRVDVRDEPGTWAWSAWPWLVNGVVNAAGTTLLRDVVTGQDRAVPVAGRGVTACSPLWCHVVSLARDGGTRIELMQPDGSARRTVADARAGVVIADVAVLDRFEVISQLTATSEVTGNIALLVYDIVTRSTVEISPDAFAVSYRAGVLWWSTGSQQSFLRHAVDLRTV